MKTKISILIASIFAVLAVSFTACEKETVTVSTDSEVQHGGVFAMQRGDDLSHYELVYCRPCRCPHKHGVLSSAGGGSGTSSYCESCLCFYYTKLLDNGTSLWIYEGAPGVEVTFTIDATTQYFYTDEFGHLDLSGLDEGTYTVEATQSGYVTWQDEITIDDEGDGDFVGIHMIAE